MKEFKVGDIVTLNIVDIKPYGLFAKHEGYDFVGFVHISQITNKFINDINDYFEKGDTITAKIIEISEDRKSVKLSIKEVDNIVIKRKKKKIKETVFGFYLLEKFLPKWIDKKMEEINKKS